MSNPRSMTLVSIAVLGLAALATADVRRVASPSTEQTSTVVIKGQSLTTMPGSTVQAPDGQRITAPSVAAEPAPVQIEYQENGDVLVRDSSGNPLGVVPPGGSVSFDDQASNPGTPASESAFSVSDLTEGRLRIIRNPMPPPVMRPLAAIQVTCPSGHSGNCLGRYRCKPAGGSWSPWTDTSVIPGSTVTYDCGPGNEIEYEVR